MLGGRGGTGLVVTIVLATGGLTHGPQCFGLTLLAVSPVGTTGLAGVVVTGVLAGTVLAFTILVGPLLGSTVLTGIVLSLAPTLTSCLTGVALAVRRGRLTAGSGLGAARTAGLLTVLTRGRSATTQ